MKVPDARIERPETVESVHRRGRVGPGHGDPVAGNRQDLMIVLQQDNLHFRCSKIDSQEHAPSSWIRPCLTERNINTDGDDTLFSIFLNVMHV